MEITNIGKIRGGRKNIKVLFIEAPFKPWKAIGEVISPYVGYANLGAVLIENGFEVACWYADSKTFKDMEDDVAEYAPDVVGIGIFTTSAVESLEAIRRVKQLNPDIVTILGGYHVSFLSEMYAKDRGVDFVAIGEAEYTLLELVQELTKPNPNFRNIKGLAFFEDDEYRKTPPRPLAKSLDEFPVPAYHLLNIEARESIGYVGAFFQLVTSRGCVHNCRFCAQWRIFNRTHRSRSAERVIEELDILCNKHNVHTLGFLDDDFHGDRGRTEALANLLAERKLPISWMAEARVDEIIRDKDLFPKLREGGCIGYETGVESYSPEVLEYARKDISFQQTKDAFKILSDNGIGSICNYIIGWPNETRESIKRGLDAMLEINPDVIYVHIYTPWPGSPLWEEALRNGDILDFNFSHYNERFPLLRIPNLKPEELMSLRDWVYEHFYTKAKIMRALHLRHPRFGDSIRGAIENPDDVYEKYSDYTDRAESLDEALEVRPRHGM